MVEVKLLKNNQLGKFSISREMVIREKPYVLRVMSKCIIVRCELLFHVDRFDYVALSEDFSKVLPGMEIPDYEIVIGDNEQIMFVVAQK